MKKLFTSITIFFMLVSGGYCAPVYSHAALTKEITMGVFPRRNAKITIKSFTPLAQYLEQQLGVKINLQTAKTFKQFWQNVQQRKYDIVHFNQLHYILSHDAQGYEVIVKNEEFGSDKLAGAIVVRTDSGINKLSDLKGKTILFGGGSKAMIAYVVNKSLLLQAGLNEGDYIEKFAINPPNATIAMYRGRADAAGIGDVGLKLPVLKKKGVDVANLKVIAQSEPLPHIPWAVNADMAPALREKIKAAMLRLNDSAEGRAILKNAMLTGLRGATDAEYDVHRKIYQSVSGKNH